MRLRKAAIFAACTAALLVSCASEAPQKAKEPAKPAEPVGGRYAFHQTYVTARTWATDLELLRVRNLPIQGAPAAPGKSAIWEVTFVSPSKGRAKSYTYSVIESGNIHKGVYGGIEESYSGPRGQVSSFPTAALKIDTVAALETAAGKSKEYIAKNPDKPITFLLEKTPRHPNPAWRVIWGTSVASSDYSVYVDASSGAYLERMR
jgi:hypothetical protein